MPTKSLPFFTPRLRARAFRALGAALLFPLLFTACTEDTEDIALPQEAALPQMIQLAPAPSEWVTLQGTEGTDFDDLEKAKRATTAPGVDRGRFNITLKYIVPTTDEQKAVFEGAAARWERIIIKDVPSFTGTIPSAFTGFPPAINGTIDDIVIEVALAPIDGPGGTLGQAGPRFVRTSDNLTLSGVMFFDVADLDFLDEIGLFEEVIVHEMGHVLGVGTLWDFGGRNLRRAEDTNPYFAGKQANVFWNAEGGTYELPVENSGGPGTALSHWRESVLRNELMTGFLNLGENPLSRITAGSMRDLGYGAAMVGEQYDLPDGAMGVNIDGDDDGMDDEANGNAGIDIAAREITLLPIGSVTTK
ncbi:leishmanolysin-related zinc metalloendopeptidase [Lewinella sp. IMCC34183]|uniref:leishmanolysin-related zinc metalloendopeptidase n=1 Tax=Lewinella sp. IMCC34183 TaxID=2248762 RepID=UPI000E25A3A7|nr:leishmanolysin-related zinc metalloendopeptidase [Lewinella sp. IMCC34183]